MNHLETLKNGRTSNSQLKIMSSHTFSLLLLIHFFITFDTVDHFFLLETPPLAFWNVGPGPLANIIPIQFVSFPTSFWYFKKIVSLILWPFFSHFLKSSPFFRFYHWWFLKLSSENSLFYSFDKYLLLWAKKAQIGFTVWTYSLLGIQRRKQAMIIYKFYKSEV